MTSIGPFCFGSRVYCVLAPRNPTAEKLTTYECGEEATGSAWLPFNSRFYVIALVFLLFDVEMVFVFPWATVFANADVIAADSRWGVLSLTEMFIFLGILILGLAYVWRKGDLEWIKPNVIVPTTDSRVPQLLYDQLNAKQSGFKVKEFSPEVGAVTLIEAATANAVPVLASKPAFKPTFKKPANDA